MKRSPKRGVIVAAAILAMLCAAIGVEVTREAALPHMAALPLVLSEFPAPYGSKGVAGGGVTELVGADAYYGWNVGPVAADEKRVRMVWCLSDEWLGAHGAEVVPAAQADHAAGIRRVWLINNEPAHPFLDQCNGQHIDEKQVYKAPRETALRYKAMYDTIKLADPRARVYAGGILHIGVDETGRWWWTEFIDELAGHGWLYTVEGVHVHAYPRWATYCADPFSGDWPQGGDWCMPGMYQALQEWHDDYHDGLGLGDRPLWLTETGCASYVADLAPYGDAAWVYCRDNVMAPMQEWFGGQDDYQALYWFIGKTWAGGGEHWWPTALVVDGELTPLGLDW